MDVFEGRNFDIKSTHRISVDAQIEQVNNALRRAAILKSKLWCVLL